MTAEPATPSEPDLELPELQEGTLTPDQVIDLIREIEAHGQVLGAQTKGAPRRITPDGDLDLWEAVNAFLFGDVIGVQIRYRYAGSFWADTLLRHRKGIRVVRICQDQLYGGAP